MAYKRKRGNSWQVEVFKGRDPETGKKLRVWETVHGNAGQANDRASEIETDINRGEYIEPSKLTFYQFLINDFLPHIEADKSIGTYMDYCGIVKNHIKNDILGRMIITKITNREATAYKLRKLKADRIDGRPGKLSPKTVKNHIILIKAAFVYACEMGIFKNSPVQHLTFPELPEYEPDVFSDEQAHKFIEAARERVVNSKDDEEYRTNFKFYLFFLLALYTGMRQGELRGLRWPDINTNTCLLSVNQQVRGSGNKAIYKKPKTKASKSSVSFDSEFIPLFEVHRKNQQRDMEKCAALRIDYHNNHLVFSGYNGNPLDRKVIERNFGYICEVAVVEKIRLHGLRHSCATLLLGEGVPLKVVQERLRQADIRTTGDTYSHVLPKMQQDANEKMNKILKFKTRSS